QCEETRKLLLGLAVDDAHVRTSAGTSATNDVRNAVAVEVAGGYADAAGECRVEGEELAQRLALVRAAERGVEHLPVRPAAGVGPSDDGVAPRRHRYDRGCLRRRRRRLPVAGIIGRDAEEAISVAVCAGEGR